MGGSHRTRLNTKNILIGNTYGNINEAIAEISETMSQIPNTEQYEILILGDFNVDLRWKETSTWRNYETICTRAWTPTNDTSGLRELQIKTINLAISQYIS